MHKLKTLTATVFLTALTATAYAAPPQEQPKNVVLVHGALMDGSGWRPVYDILKKKGLDVSVVQLSLKSLDDDVAATKRALDQQNGPVVLVGHSYGGAVISVAGLDPKVKSLVYVAALQPDAGESVAELNARKPMKAHLQALGDNLVMGVPSEFHGYVAADLPADQAAFLAASQTPTSVELFTQKVSAVAWHAKPSYGVIATEDRTIDPELMRFMYGRSKVQVTEVKASHVVHISQPDTVAKVIMQAVEGAK